MNIQAEISKAKATAKRNRFNILYAAFGLGVITAGLLIGGKLDADTAKAEEAYVKQGETRTIMGTAYDWGQTLITDDGHEWYVIDPPEFAEGQRVLVTFATNGTDDVTDDEIVGFEE